MLKKISCLFVGLIIILTFSACLNDEGRFSFYATVLEIGDSHLLVEPLEGEAERNSADKITITKEFKNSSGLPDLTVGDKIYIEYDGMIAESYPAQINNVYSITLPEGINSK